MRDRYVERDRKLGEEIGRLAREHVSRESALHERLDKTMRDKLDAELADMKAIVAHECARNTSRTMALQFVRSAHP